MSFIKMSKETLTYIIEAISDKIKEKQDSLTFDSTPTSGSSNPVTSGGVYTALSGKQSSISGGATTILHSNLTSSRALVSSSSGKVSVSEITDTELSYLGGATSNIQDQIDAKQDDLTEMTDDEVTSVITEIFQ